MIEFEKDEPKVWLVLSGGGAKGCFQVGAINAIKEWGLEIAGVSGVSTGNLQMVFVAMQDYELMDRIWASIRQKDVYREAHSFTDIGWKYLWSKLGLAKFDITSIYDFSPLRRLIGEHADISKFKIPARSGVVCLEDGKYYTIAISNGTVATPDGRRVPAHPPDFIYASCCLPGSAAPVEIAGRHYLDGGVRNMTPLKEALEAGADHIILIECSPLDIESWEYKGNILDIGTRSLSMALNEIYNEDLSYMKFINQMVDSNCVDEKYRKIKFTVIAPENEVIDTLCFDRKQINAGIDYGYDRAMEIIKEEY
jgi:NTE family protein